MKLFTDLYTSLDETTKTNEKIAAMRAYFEAAPAADAAWAVFFLTGRKPKQIIQAPKLAAWASETAGVPFWMFDESYDAVGDLAETMALLLPFGSTVTTRSLALWVEETLLPLRAVSEDVQRQVMVDSWQQMNDAQRFIWNKLITGAFRVGVSQQLVIRALSAYCGVDAKVIAHRMMGNWEPTAEFFQTLVSKETDDTDISRPYPFFLAYPLEAAPETLGDVTAWQSEWKWDGIRSQVIRRDDQVFIWSRGEELITDRYPEIVEDAMMLANGTVLDGEILGWKEANVLPFAQLQQRIGRKAVSKKLLSDVPVILMAYDLLEFAGEDWRDKPLSERRAMLTRLLMGFQSGTADSALVPSCQRISSRLRISPVVQAGSWEELASQRETARSLNVEGIMLKRLSSPYRVGRQRGDWWKWKVNPYTVDAVLIYAQRGSGKRASLYTDYTFGIWDKGALVPIAKAYSGLTDEEIRQVDLFVRQNTTDKFGPVRVVKPELVFELAFEGIQRSSRHKSGIAVRFPRMNRWRQDKPPQEADTIETIEGLLQE
ncbi:MAG TPA: ATP-dependent DNA ligase [Planktothrix sp.]|jgi:DNA ligase-1